MAPSHLAPPRCAEGWPGIVLMARRRHPGPGWRILRTRLLRPVYHSPWTAHVLDSEPPASTLLERAWSCSAGHRIIEYGSNVSLHPHTPERWDTTPRLAPGTHSLLGGQEKGTGVWRLPNSHTSPLHPGIELGTSVCVVGGWGA